MDLRIPPRNIKNLLALKPMKFRFLVREFTMQLQVLPYVHTEILQVLWTRLDQDLVFKGRSPSMTYRQLPADSDPKDLVREMSV